MGNSSVRRGAERSPRPSSRAISSGGPHARPPHSSREPARSRFLRTDGYRAAREWDRNEGTAQRALFRELRVRFLRRHAVPAPWVLDVGSGPGRFTRFLGGPASRRVALDLSRVMLKEFDRRTLPGSDRLPAERVCGDAMHPPFPGRKFGEVAVLGNVVGFAEAESELLLASVESLVAPGGTLLIEIAPGPGEGSRYLHRLPPSAVARLLSAPLSAVLARVGREGFLAGPVRRRPSAFRRMVAGPLIERWRAAGWAIDEVVAVAPALGLEPERVAAAWSGEQSRSHLLALEEQLGLQEARLGSAAAVLLAARAPAPSA